MLEGDTYAGPHHKILSVVRQISMFWVTLSGIETWRLKMILGTNLVVDSVRCKFDLFIAFGEEL